jgi:hypothetical protein
MQTADKAITTEELAANHPPASPIALPGEHQPA